MNRRTNQTTAAAPGIAGSREVLNAEECTHELAKEDARPTRRAGEEQVHRPLDALLRDRIEAEDDREDGDDEEGEGRDDREDEVGPAEERKSTPDVRHEYDLGLGFGSDLHGHVRRADGERESYVSQPVRGADARAGHGDGRGHRDAGAVQDA